MQVNRYLGRGRGWRDWVVPGLQVGGYLANSAIRSYLGRPQTIVYQQPDPLASQMANMSIQPAQQSRARGGRRRGRGGRGRGGRGRGRGALPLIAPPGSGAIVAEDTEIIVVKTADKPAVVALVFNPAVTETPRLLRYEEMFERYRVVYFRINYKGACSANQRGNIQFAITPEAKSANVTVDKIAQLKPYRSVACWQTGSIKVDQRVGETRYLECGGSQPAFTFYYVASGEEGQVVGNFHVSYKIQFAYPKVFT
ncbi:hypothetical protein 4 [Hubei tombus-like virus 18]|uniref:hypothetical protein 4 n=1 Tax=Hubei tombus-like virus 18 TaxID=1923264 RepID=UPI000909758C|nr:hypothetical protein 4 [Hubei tombus-like virus 18]APG76336.1 hypothetical protein 4 [Hubei tombus-like virus 18]